MKITRRQIMLLYQILQGSVRIKKVGVFGLSLEDRLKLLKEIINQQDTKLEDIE